MLCALAKDASSSSTGSSAQAKPRAKEGKAKGKGDLSSDQSRLLPHLLRIIEFSHGRVFKYNSQASDFDPTNNQGLVGYLSTLCNGKSNNPHEEGLVHVTSSRMGTGSAAAPARL